MRQPHFLNSKPLARLLRSRGFKYGGVSHTTHGMFIPSYIAVNGATIVRGLSPLLMVREVFRVSRMEPREAPLTIDETAELPQPIELLEAV